jgi:hypothetical protein
VTCPFLRLSGLTFNKNDFYKYASLRAWNINFPFHGMQNGTTGAVAASKWLVLAIFRVFSPKTGVFR